MEIKNTFENFLCARKPHRGTEREIPTDKKNLDTPASIDPWAEWMFLGEDSRVNRVN